MIKIFLAILIIAVVAVHADDCPDSVKSAFKASVTKCKAQPSDQQVTCMSTELRSRSEFTPFVAKCPDPTVKGCLKGEIEKACPGLTTSS